MQVVQLSGVAFLTGTIYYVTVLATDSAGNSSNTTSVASLADLTPPVASHVFLSAGAICDLSIADKDVDQAGPGHQGSLER